MEKVDNVENIDNAKKEKKPKLKSIFIIVLVVIPLLILTFRYFNNKSFKNKVNNLLGKLPGAVGEHFTLSSNDVDGGDRKSVV